MVSAEEQLMQQKQQRTAALRQEYIKAVSNPHRHASGEGGVIVRNPGLYHFTSPTKEMQRKFVLIVL